MARLSLTFATLFALCCLSQLVLGSALPNSSRALSAKNSWSASTSKKFCHKFTKECYKVALKGKTGHVKVVQQCERHGKKHSHSYSFGCKSDGKDVTKKVLHNIGEGTTVTTEAVSVKTASVTITSPTTTKTQTKTSTVTTIVATVPVVQISLAPASSPLPIGKRSVDKSKFCSAFSNGCETRCSKIKSTPKHTVCHSTSLHHYSLACQCTNGKMETQHALYAAAGKQRVETISTVSTTYKTVATVKPTHTVTKNVITTVKATASSTTQVVLATMGAIEVYSEKEETDESSLGFIYQNGRSRTIAPFVVDYSDFIPPQEFVAVLDAKTNLYQFQTPEDPDAWIGLSPHGTSNSAGVDFANKNAVAYALPLTDDACGTSSNGPGHPLGSYDCESYVFGLKGDKETIIDGTANVTMQWYNPNASSAKEYSWVIDSQQNLAAASNPKLAKPDGNPATQVFLRYPIPVPDDSGISATEG